ncbi:MAG: hypothetical protein HUU26_11485 [Gemmatimonadaceae bacterium]|nr:hypothetical protein [Gemmatimonadaceae bacterium]
MPAGRAVVAIIVLAGAAIRDQDSVAAPPRAPDVPVSASTATGAPSGASSDAWFGLVGAALGGLIGVGSTVLAIAATDRQARRQRAAALEVARHTIIAEVVVNRLLIRQDHEWIRDERGPADLAPIERAAMYPPPAVITSAWDGQVGVLSEAFTLDEIAELQLFYLSARSTVSTRQTLHSLLAAGGNRVGMFQAFDVYEAYAERAIAYVVPKRLEKYLPTAATASEPSRHGPRAAD